MSSEKTRFDMHVHTKYSGDSRLDPWELVRVCKKKGLSGVAVTDHNTIKGGIETSKIKGGLEVIVGAEIMTDHGEVVGYHLNQEIRSTRIEEVLDEIMDQGGYVSVPHPFDSVRKGSLDRGKLGEIAGRLDYVETRNGRSFWFSNGKAERFALEHKIPALGGSDAHMGFEIGRCSTVFRDAERMVVDHVEGGINPLYPLYPLLRTKFYKIFQL